MKNGSVTTIVWLNAPRKKFEPVYVTVNVDMHIM